MAEKSVHDALHTSEETSATEIPISKAEGAAYGAALMYLSTAEGSNAGRQEIDDYEVAYCIEEAEGLYFWQNGGLVWHEPEKENVHLEVAVRNRADGRFLPGLNVTVTLADSDGKEIGTHPMPFLWHPWIYHYGRSWVVPHDGDYEMRIHIDAPTFPRHDKVNGNCFTRPVDVKFKVKIKTGRKKTTKEAA
jgi:uncharacterized protein involved in high-affinity Fe2+ transport